MPPLRPTNFNGPGCDLRGFKKKNNQIKTFIININVILEIKIKLNIAALNCLPLSFLMSVSCFFFYTFFLTQHGPWRHQTASASIKGTFQI